MTSKYLLKKTTLVLFCTLVFCVSIGSVWLIHGVLVTLMLSNIDGWHAEFFPDGNRIVFSVPFNNREQKGIYVFDRENGDAIRLTQPDYRDGFPTVFPDGQKIIFSRGNTMNIALWIMDVDGSNKRALTFPPLFSADYGAFTSPNGKYIAFCRKSFAGHADLLLLELETSKIIRLQQKINRFRDGCLRWKNDEEILFFSDSSSFSFIDNATVVDSIRIVNVQTGEIRSMALPGKERMEDIRSYQDISFSTNQELLLLCPNKPYLYQLCIRKLFSEETPHILTDGQFNVSNALFHPNGEAVLFGTNEIKNGSVYSRTFYFFDIKAEHIEKLFTVSP